MFLQQIAGVINLSLPLIILYNIQSSFLTTFWAQIFCSFSVGAYVYYCAYKQLHNLENSLQYSPTGECKELFDAMIKDCGIDPENIILKYAYTQGTMAMTAGKTVIIDPVVWHGLENDAQAMQVKNIFHEHIEKNISIFAKERIWGIHQLLTDRVERFIFKHELAHVIFNFSIKKLLILFFSSSLAAYCGIVTAVSVLQVHSLFAIFSGMFIGGIIDFIFTLVSNIIWKLQVEKQADGYAVRFSSKEDVQAAALFFEEHQALLDKFKDPKDYLGMFPSEITSGHQHGKLRSAYLLTLLDQK